MSLVSNQDVVVEEENPEVTLAQILNVSNFVEKYLDIDMRLCLRATCTTIREIINEKPLDIGCLHYDCYGNCIEISTNGDLKISYDIFDDELRVKYWDKEKRISMNNEKDQTKIIQRDLMSILCNEKLRIDTLRIESFRKSDVGMRALQNTLNQVPNKLKVLNLDYYVEECERKCFIAALKTIDLEHLKSLQLRFGHDNYVWDPVFKDLYDLEEWKRVKSLKVKGGLSLSETISNYTHFENAHMEIIRERDGTDNVICFEQDPPVHTFVMELKDKLLENPTLKQLKIRMHEKIRGSDFEDIKASLQQYNTNNAPYPCWVSIPYPDSDKKLKILVDKRIIWFKGPCYVEEEWEEERTMLRKEKMKTMPLVFNQDVVVEEEKPKVTLTQILNVPDFVENHLDIDTRLCLRATCTTIRKIINEKLLDIDRLTYKCEGKFTEISTNRDFKISYEIIEGGLRVRYWNKEKVINTDDEVDQTEIIQRDFMSIFGHEKLRIEFLIIEDSLGPWCFRKYRIGRTALQRTFNELLNKLKVRNLVYCADEWNFALLVALRTTDPEHLESLQIDIDSLCDDQLGYYDQYLYDLEEWKRLKSLKFDGMLMLSDIISNYTHFENSHLRIFRDSEYYEGCLCYASDLPVHRVVMELKDKILSNPNLKQLKIRMNWKIQDSDFEYIKASLQQYNTNNVPFPCWVSIPYPDSDKKLEMLVKKKIIWFKGPSYVKGEWEYESSDEEDEEDSSDEEENDEEDEVGEDAEEGDEEKEEVDEDEILPLNALNLNDS